MITEIFRRVHDKDLLLSERYLSRTLFYSAYWVHRRIERALASQTHKAGGILLDLGCGRKPYEQLFTGRLERYVGIEYSLASGYRGNAADICGDASHIPLRSGSVDTVLCTEVLEHVPNPDLVISEVARVLKPGGAFLCTAPFVYPVHDSFDFYRYSPIGVATIAQRHGLEVEEIIPLSGTGLTLAVMFNLYWFEIGFRWTKWLYPIGLLLRPILLLLTFIVNICGWIFERILPSNHLSFNHLTVARQPAQGISTKSFDIPNESVKAGSHKLNG